MLVSKLPGTLPEGAPGSPRAVPALPSPRDVRGREDVPHAAQAGPAQLVEGGAAAVGASLYSLSWGEAPAIGVVGDRGSGKSTAMRGLAAGYLHRSVGIVLAVDAGAASGFPGQRRVSVADLAARPMATEPRLVVFTGDACSGVDVDPEGVAALAWRLAARRTPSLVVVDELTRAARRGFWTGGAKWLPQACSEGRKHGVGIVWGTQSPQTAPLEAFEQAGVILCFRLGGLGLNRLREREYLRGVPDGTIEDLPGDDVAPAERGRFVLLCRARPWNGKFYRFGV